MVFISLGSEGLFYMDRSCRGRLAPPKADRVVSVTGAGDAMSAAIVDGIARDLDIRTIGCRAVRAAGLTLLVRETVDPDIGQQWGR
jgi:sugar/nucleoside kinase (ribokinase family)